MSTFLILQKEQRWQEITAMLAEAKDKLGKRIDAGIFETVVALNALDIPTFASCEGHLEWGTGAPWIDIAAQHPATQISISRLNTEALAERERGEKTPAEIVALFEDIHKRRREVKTYHIQVRQKLLALLAAFYQQRSTLYDCRLIVRPLGTDGKSRLESQGADCQEVMPQEIRTQKLTAYQQEMAEFATFLKNVFFATE